MEQQEDDRYLMGIDWVQTYRMERALARPGSRILSPCEHRGKLRVLSGYVKRGQHRWSWKASRECHLGRDVRKGQVSRQDGKAWGEHAVSQKRMLCTEMWEQKIAWLPREAASVPPQLGLREGAGGRRSSR